MTAAALFSTPCHQVAAQPWAAILDIDGSAQHAMAIDPFSLDPAVPNLIVAGDVAGALSGTLHGLSQSDETLTALDPENTTTYVRGLGYNLSGPAFPGYGNLFAVGAFSRLRADGTEVPNWSVRRRVHNGSSWGQVDNFVLADAWSEARGIAIDDLGNVYVCGMATDPAGISHWIIRKSTDQGATWSTTDLFQGSAAASVITGNNWVTALGICFVPNGNSPGGAARPALGKQFSALGASDHAPTR